MSIPDSVVPIAEPLSQADQRQIKLASDPWSDDYALDIVKSDWAYAESYRTNAHDWRYRNADELYLAWVGQRYWDGTRVPRSSIGVPVVYSQIEALLPKTVPAVTNPDGYFFYSETDLGDDEELIVMAWKEMVVKQLEETRFRVQVARALKCMKQHGNGVLEAGVEDYEEEFIQFKRSTRPTGMRMMNHPLAGPVPVPTGTSEDYSRSIKREKKQRPYVRYVSLKDFYVDPSCESTVLQEGAGYVMKRVYMTAGQIKALRSSKDFKIPDDEYLTNLSKAKATANQDVTKLSSELFRYNMWNPAQDYSVDPAQKRIAVIEYTTNARKIWWLQGGLDTQSVIYNKSNRYGEINYYSVPYADVLDRWHAMSLCDVAEGEQRLQQAIINSRIDELALGLHRPLMKRRGVTIPAYQLKVRPGVVIETEQPEDVKQMEVLNITQNAFVEVQASELRVQKMVGLSDLAGQGVPTAGGNSANRTATGVNTQAGAQESRINYLIETIEDMLIEPVVTAVIRYNKKFMDPKQAANWLKLDKRFQKLNPENVMNARIACECRASVKMRARMNFLQIFPQLSQTYLNPEVLQLLGKVGKKFNIEEWLHMSMDALNYAPRKALIQDMTKEEQAAMNQPPAEAKLKMQAAQQQQQSQEGINDKRLIAKLLETVIKMGFQNHAKFAELDDKHQLGIADLLLGATGAGDQGDSAGATDDSGEGQ